MVSLHEKFGNHNLQFYVTFQNRVCSVPESLDNSIFEMASTAEEAEQKAVRHTLNCLKTNFDHIEIHSIDTDVLIQLLANVADEVPFCNENPRPRIYFKLVTPNASWFDVVSLIELLGTDVCKALPFFFGITGCDSVESFNGKGKCTFFDAWMKSADKDSITQLFIKLGNMPEKADVDMSIIETLVKQVYYRNVRNSDTTSLNQLRKYQFMSTTSNDVRKIAPSSDALYMHSLRAAYTSRHNVGVHLERRDVRPRLVTEP